jgi:hypothetical protein
MSTENGGTDLDRRRVSRSAPRRDAVQEVVGRRLSPKAGDSSDRGPAVLPCFSYTQQRRRKTYLAPQRQDLVVRAVGGSSCERVKWLCAKFEIRLGASSG